MARNFRELVKDDIFWSQGIQLEAEALGRFPDCLMQNREEFIRLCEWIEAENIRSYLEIGIWTGRTLSLLHRLFQFDTVAACDPMTAVHSGHEIHLPEDAKVLKGLSHSVEFMSWRHQLGHIDLVLIDGDHSYSGVRQDFDINQRYPHRYLMFHDISGITPGTEGVGQLWRELGGRKREFVLPSPADGIDPSGMGLGIWARS